MTPATRSALVIAAAGIVSKQRAVEVEDRISRKEREAVEPCKAGRLVRHGMQGTLRTHDRKQEFLSTFARYPANGIASATASAIAGTKKARRKLKRAARRVLVTHHS